MREKREAEPQTRTENKGTAAYQMRGEKLIDATMWSPVPVCATTCVPDDHLSLSVQVMEADLFLRHPLPLLGLPAQRKHVARRSCMASTTGATGLQRPPSTPPFHTQNTKRRFKRSKGLKASLQGSAS